MKNTVDVEIKNWTYQGFWETKVFKNECEYEAFKGGNFNASIEQFKKCLEIRDKFLFLRHRQSFKKRFFNFIWSPKIKDLDKMLQSCEDENVYRMAIDFAVTNCEYKFYKAIIKTAYKNGIDLTDSKFKVNRFGCYSFNPIGLCLLHSNFLKILKFTDAHTRDDLELLVLDYLNSRRTIPKGCSNLSHDDLMTLSKIKAKYNFKILQKLDGILVPPEHLKKQYLKKMVGNKEHAKDLNDKVYQLNTIYHSIQFSADVNHAINEIQRKKIYESLEVVLKNSSQKNETKKRKM